MRTHADDCSSLAAEMERKRTVLFCASGTLSRNTARVADALQSGAFASGTTMNAAASLNKAQPSVNRRSFLIAAAAAAQVTLIPLGAAQAAASSAQKSASASAVEEFRRVTALQDLAFEYTNQLRFADAEVLWTKLISLNESNAAAYSNRGNCRTSQAKFDEAIEDFKRAIALAPEEPDSYLGLGVALEGLRKYEYALQAFQTSNQLSEQRFGKADAVALNNIGNAYGGLGNWKQAFEFYRRAALTDSKFVFALANQALAEFELGMDEDAVQTMRFLTRKYARFSDMHAAMAMVLWERGDGAQAEEEWFKAVQTDGRYEDVEWVREVRRWPPRLVSILTHFHAPRSSPTATRS